jgi:hypothetical protein
MLAQRLLSPPGRETPSFLAHPGTKLEQGRLVRRGHALTGRRHHKDPMPLGQQSKAKGIEEALVSRDEARKAFDQVIQQAKVMGASRQQGKRGDHPPARDTQAQFEAVVVQLFGGAVPIVRKRFKAAVTPTTGRATDRQRQGVNDLERLCGLSTHAGQARLNRRFHPPQVGGLPNERRAVGQTRKEGNRTDGQCSYDVKVTGRN